MEARSVRAVLSKVDCSESILEVVLRPDKIFAEFLLVDMFWREVRYLLTMDSFILYDPWGKFLLSLGDCRVEIPGLDG